MFFPSKNSSPSTRAASIRSFIRLIERRNVDFPHPEGPIIAVTCFAGISSETLSSAWRSS